MSEHLSSALARRDFACAERFQRTLPVVVTTASATYARVLEAWSTRLDAYGVAQRVVIALGLGVDAACRVRYDVASPDLLAGIVGLSKFEVSRALLERGHRVLYSELDVVWLADAYAAAATALAGRSGGSFDAADAVAAMDNERDDELNVGFVLATPGPRTREWYARLVAGWREALAAAGGRVPFARDQAFFWATLRDGGPDFARLDSRVFAKLTKRGDRPRAVREDPRVACFHVTGLATDLKLTIVRRLYEGGGVGDVLRWADEAAGAERIAVAAARRAPPAPSNRAMVERIKAAQARRARGAAPPPAYRAPAAVAVAPLLSVLGALGLLRWRRRRRRGDDE